MRRGLFVVALFAATAAFSPSVARAQLEVTLTGESGDAAVTSASLTCSSTSTGVLTYDAVGTAIGPYPGTYEEHGTVRYENGTVTSFNATFTIDSPAGQVQGQKTLEIGLDATCGLSETAQSVQAGADTRYDATITTSAGTFRDHGSGSSGVAVTALSGTVAGTASANYHSDRETAKIELTPVESVDPVGTTHTVTALVQDALDVPIQGATVLFTVTGSTETTGRCTTDVTGTCNFTYLGPSVPGADLITGCYDFDDDGMVDPTEKCATATKAWVAELAGPGGATGGGYIASATAGSNIAFGFAAEPGAVTPNGSCAVIDQTANVRVKCLDVTALVALGTHATFLGEATVNGVATNYRIDVDDLGDPGADRDTFKIVTDSGYTAAGVLTAGDIHIRTL
jgi:hypothetical protein